MSTKKISSKELFSEYGDLSFAEVLYGFRKSDDASQVDFARKIGISAANLCDLEKGRKLPSAFRAALIARKLGLPEELLIQVALQDDLRKQKLKFRVKVAV